MDTNQMNSSETLNNYECSLVPSKYTIPGNNYFNHGQYVYLCVTIQTIIINMTTKIGGICMRRDASGK